MHSGDSAAPCRPRRSLADVLSTIERHTRALADALEVVGLLNVQYAVKDGVVFVLEANPRASRTVPFVAKATGVPLAMVAARVMVGESPRLAPASEGSCRRRRRTGRAARPRQREGGGAALRPVPRGRHPARPRDALDRRGDGGRRDLRPRLRQEPDGRRHPAARRRARCSSRSPTGTSRPGSRWPASFGRSGSRSPRPSGPPATCAAHGVRGRDPGGQGRGGRAGRRRRRAHRRRARCSWW